MVSIALTDIFSSRHCFLSTGPYITRKLSMKLTMASTYHPFLRQFHRPRLLQEAGAAVLLSLLLIVCSGSGASPGLKIDRLSGHADFTPVHDTAFIPARQHVLVNIRHHPEPEDASDTWGDASLPDSATVPGFCPPSSPRYASTDQRRPLLQSSACPARAPPRFS